MTRDNACRRFAGAPNLNFVSITTLEMTQQICGEQGRWAAALPSMAAACNSRTARSPRAWTPETVTWLGRRVTCPGVLARPDQ
jgi:hypothetical protein